MSFPSVTHIMNYFLNGRRRPLGFMDEIFSGNPSTGGTDRNGPINNVSGDGSEGVGARPSSSRKSHVIVLHGTSGTVAPLGQSRDGKTVSLSSISEDPRGSMFDSSRTSDDRESSCGRLSHSQGEALSARLVSRHTAHSKTNSDISTTCVAESKLSSSGNTMQPVESGRPTSPTPISSVAKSNIPTEAKPIRFRMGENNWPRRTTSSRARHVKKQQQPFWTRLLCQPEVYDPYIEAAPMNGSLSLRREDLASVLPPRDDKKDIDQPERVLGQPSCRTHESVECTASAASPSAQPEEEEEEDDDGYKVLHSPTNNGLALSDASRIADCHFSGQNSHDPMDEPNSANGDSDVHNPLALSPSLLCTSGEAPTTQKNVFVIRDTRVAAPPPPVSVNSCSNAAARRMSLDDVQAPLTPLLKKGFMQADIAKNGWGAVQDLNVAADEAEDQERERMQLLVERRWRREQQDKRAATRLKEERAALRALLLAAEKVAIKQRNSGAEADTTSSPSNAATDSSNPNADSKEDREEVGGSPTPVIALADIPSSAAHLLNGGAGGKEDIEPQKEEGSSGCGQDGTHSHPNSSFDSSVFFDDEHTDTFTAVGAVFEHKMGGVTPSNMATEEDISPGISLSFPAHSDEPAGCIQCRIADLAHKRPLSKKDKKAAARRAGARAFAPPIMYPLGSRQYMERVLLAQRGQQVFALMALLTEAHGVAWENYLRLIQLYYYYVNPILASVAAQPVPDAAERAAQLERTLVDSSPAVRRYHAELRNSGAGYAYLKYTFDTPWRNLFLAARHYLNLDEHGPFSHNRHCGSENSSNSNSNCSSTTTAAADGETATPTTETEMPWSQSPQGDAASVEKGEHPDGADHQSDVHSKDEADHDQQKTTGTVCFAATLLHSMELFERYSHLRCAVYATEMWLEAYYKGGSPTTDALSEKDTTQARGEERNTEAADVTGDTPEQLQLPAVPLVGSPVYMPMHWAAAQNEHVRASVYWKRRQSKLTIMAAADHLLDLTSMREDDSCSECTATTTPSEAEAKHGSGIHRERRDILSDMDSPLGVPHDMKKCDNVEESHGVAMMGPGAAGFNSLHVQMTAPLREDTSDGSNEDDGLATERDATEVFVPRNFSADAYHTVDVGCFGFSFLSLFD